MRDDEGGRVGGYDGEYEYLLVFALCEREVHVRELLRVHTQVANRLGRCEKKGFDVRFVREVEACVRKSGQQRRGELFERREDVVHLLRRVGAGTLGFGSNGTRD